MPPLLKASITYVSFAVVSACVSTFSLSLHPITDNHSVVSSPPSQQLNIGGGF